MPAVTILPARDRRPTRVAAAAFALLVVVGCVSAALMTDNAGAAPAKKPCVGKGCAKGGAGESPAPTASPTATPAPAPSESSPAPDATSASPVPSQATQQPSQGTASSTPSPTSSTSPPAPSGGGGGDTPGTWVSPEGATISVAADVVGWTPKKVYDVLEPNAYQLGLIGPRLKVSVSLDGYNSTSTAAGTSGSAYTNFSASISLNGRADSSLNTNADRLIAHEYGHAWTLYHLYLSQNKNWTPYLDARGLSGNVKLDSSVTWDRKELIADDYRMLFGTAAAVGGASYLNREVTDPRNVPGLKEFFITTWAKG